MVYLGALYCTMLMRPDLIQDKTVFAVDLFFSSQKGFHR